MEPNFGSDSIASRLGDPRFAYPMTEHALRECAGGNGKTLTKIAPRADPGSDLMHEERISAAKISSHPGSAKALRPTWGGPSLGQLNSPTLTPSPAALGFPHRGARVDEGAATRQNAPSSGTQGNPCPAPAPD